MTELKLEGITGGGVPFTFTAETEDVAPFAPLGTLERVMVYFDAGVRGGNPGESACGIYAEIDLPEDKHFIYKFKVTKLLGQKTNNEAEWAGLLLALQTFRDQAPNLRQLDIRSDSKLVVMQALGAWKTRDHLIALRDEAYELLSELNARGCEVTIEHVKREFNKDADALVTDLLDTFTGKPR